MVNSLSGEPLETALPKHDDPTKLANEFGTFFLKKIDIIKENLDKFQVQEPRLLPVTPKENLKSFSTPSIEKCVILFQNPPLIPLVGWIRLFLHS